MRFLYERQTRRFYLYLVIVSILQICFLGLCGILQAQEIRRILVRRELAAASYLLEEEVPPSLIAAAWNHTEVTKEGRNWTPSTEIKLFPAGGGVFDFRPEIPYNR